MLNMPVFYYQKQKKEKKNLKKISTPYQVIFKDIILGSDTI